jgi:endonuclease-3
MLPPNISEIFRGLRQRYTEPGALEIGSPFLRLVAILLSARTRDEQVLKVLPQFAQRFGNARECSLAPIGEIERTISSIGFFRAKAKYIQTLSRQLVECFGGEVPHTIDELTRLAGVGRKTASVLLASTFGVPAIAVDVHVARIAVRLGFAKPGTPEAIERDLAVNIPQKYWQDINRTFVPFGREYCTPTAPRCYDCPLRSFCVYPQKNLEVPAQAAMIAQRRLAQRAALISLTSKTSQQLCE